MICNLSFQTNAGAEKRSCRALERKAAMHASNTSAGTRGGGRGAFTLLEVLLAVIIMGMGIVATLNSMKYSTISNNRSSRWTEAVFLAQEIRTWTENLPFSDQDTGDLLNAPGPDNYQADGSPYVDDLDDLMNAGFTPPRNSLGNPINRLAGWTVNISMDWRSDADPSVSIAEPAQAIDGNLAHIQVTVIAPDGEGLLTTGWLCARYEE